MRPDIAVGYFTSSESAFGFKTTVEGRSELVSLAAGGALVEDEILALHAFYGVAMDATVSLTEVGSATPTNAALSVVGIGTEVTHYVQPANVYISLTQALTRLSRSPHWVWMAMDPVTKLLLTIDIGDRTLAMAQRVVHQVVEVLAPGCAPLFLTDGFREYMTALLTHYGQWVQPSRRQDKGPHPKLRWLPRPQLLYAQVVKTIRRRVDKKCSATRQGWSKGIGGGDAFMKLCSSSSGCKARPAKGEPAQVGSEPCDSPRNRAGEA